MTEAKGKANERTLDTLVICTISTNRETKPWDKNAADTLHLPSPLSQRLDTSLRKAEEPCDWLNRQDHFLGF